MIGWKCAPSLGQSVKIVKHPTLICFKIVFKTQSGSMIFTKNDLSVKQLLMSSSVSYRYNHQFALKEKILQENADKIVSAHCDIDIKEIWEMGSLLS